MRARSAGPGYRCSVADPDPQGIGQNVEGQREERDMAEKRCALAVAGGVLMVMSATAPALAQKQGGILRQYMIDSPASMSIHEEATVVSERPMMGVFNNLVMF